MRRGAAVVACLSLYAAAGCGHADKRTQQQRLADAVQEVTKADTEEKKFYALGDAAKESAAAGRTDAAREYADALLVLLPNYEDNWNYGTAVQDAHLVLGRVAVAEGNIDEAKGHLLEAGKTPGSPQLDSFGPDMSLAKDLLEKGERDTVLAYFELCREFWDDGGRLDRWRDDVKAGKAPDFGANLRY
jgi:tetratricopeptide (TPR) repeat protein